MSLWVQYGCESAVQIERLGLTRTRRFKLKGQKLVRLWWGRYIVAQPKPHGQTGVYGEKPKVFIGFITRPLGKKNGQTP